MIDKHGKCCGAELCEFKHGFYNTKQPHRWCSKCGRAYKLDCNEQIESARWHKDESGTFVKSPTYNLHWLR